MRLRFTLFAIVSLFSFFGKTESLGALSYPISTPAGETVGGTYRTYFDNIFANAGDDCDVFGQVIGGFTSTGVPHCVTPVSSGLFLSGQTTGDTIYFDGTNWVRTNNIFNAGGNVGIGTTTPGSKLEVNGQVKITGGGFASGKILTSDSAGLAYWSDVAPSVSSSGITGGTENYLPKFGVGGNGLNLSQIFDNGVTIGIGTILPSASVKLDVIGDILVNAIRIGRGPSNLAGNTVFGFNGLLANIIGNSNSAFGYASLLSDIGSYNTAVGYGSLQGKAAGDNNTVIGGLAGSTLTSGDNNIFVGYNAQPNISTGASNQLNIGNWIYGDNGNIGIGVTNPSAKLEINGQIKITSGAGSGKILVSDTTGLASWQASVPASNVDAANITGGVPNYITKFGSGGVGIFQSLLYEVGGFIGLGNTNPSAELDITGQIKIRGGSPGAGRVLTSDATGLASWVNPSVATNVYATGVLAMSSSGGYITKFMPSGSGITSSFIFESGSFIGINKTNPSYILDVNGTGNFIGFRLPTGAALGKTLVSDASGNASWTTTVSGATATGITGGTQNYVSKFGTGGNGIYPSQIFDSGTGVGVATASPTTALDVNGQIRLRTGAGNGLYLVSDTTGIASWTGAVTATSLNITGQALGTTLYYNGTSWLASTNIYNSGANVGIGTATPIAKLDVNGAGRITGDLTVQGKLITDTIVNRTVNNVSISGSLLPDAATPSTYRDIGSAALPWNNLYLGGQIKIAGGSPGLGKILTSDATGLATWATGFSGTTTASGITGGTQNYVTKFGVGGNGIINSLIYDNGTNIGIGTATPGVKFELNSGSGNTSGFKFTQLTATSPIFGGVASPLGVDGSGNVVVAQQGAIPVYTALGATPNAAINTSVNPPTIGANYDKYFTINARESFTVTDVGGNPYNCPEFNIGATNKGPTGCTATPWASYVMTAQNATVGNRYAYQILISDRTDAPFVVRGGMYDSTQGKLMNTARTIEALWFKALTVPTNHSDWFYINPGVDQNNNPITGGGNVGIGTMSPLTVFEVFSGSTALLHTRGANNTAFGFGSVRIASSGNANSGFGAESLTSLTTGYSNSAFGYKSLRTTGAGFNNTAVGQESLYNNNGGSWNNAFGYQALYSNTSGIGNVGIGPQALYNLSTGNQNIAIGYQALRILAGSSVSNNIGIGYGALYSTTASNLVAVGYSALNSNTSGIQNTALGYQSLDAVTTTSGNTGLGYNTLVLTTGANNTAIGASAGAALTTGSNNIAIGANVDVTTSTASNQLNIGNWIYGNGGNIGVGTGTNLTAKLNLDSGIANFSGLRFLRINSLSPVTSTNIVGLGVNGSGEVVPVSNGDVIVYDGITTSTPNPNPNNSTRQVSYDFNQYFRIPAKQSFVITDGLNPGQNAPYIGENADVSVCEWTGTYGTGMSTCPTGDFPGSPYNSFTMSARADSNYGYQIGLAYRGDIQLMARSGKFRDGNDAGSTVDINDYGSGLYIGATNNPAPWYKVITLPTNQMQWFYIDTGYTGQWNTTGRAGRIGIGTTAPDYGLDIRSSVGMAGAVAITSGSPGVGKVLTSDATGNATWQTPSGGGGGGGGSGTTILENTVNINLPSISNNTCSDQDFSLPGASVGKVAWVSPSGSIGTSTNVTLFIASTYVSAADTVRVRFCNEAGSAINLNAMNFYVAAIQ